MKFTRELEGVENSEANCCKRLLVLNDRISGVCAGLLRSTNAPIALPSGVMEIGNWPKSSGGGDAYWARQFQSDLIIVIWDSIGHDAYAAVMSVVIAGILKSFEEKIKSSNEPLMTSQEFIRLFYRNFSDAMHSAADTLKLRSNGADALVSNRLKQEAELMSEEGVDIACLIIRGNEMEVCCAGIPIFVKRPNQEPKPIGRFNRGINVAKRQTSNRPSQRNGKNESRTKFKAIVPQGDPQYQDTDNAAFEQTIKEGWELFDRSEMEDIEYLLFATDGIVNQANPKDPNEKFGQAGLLAAVFGTLDESDVPEQHKSVGALHLDRLRRKLLAFCENEGTALQPDDDCLALLIDMRDLLDWQSKLPESQVQDVVAQQMRSH
jgi:hypothetical protein